MAAAALPPPALQAQVLHILAKHVELVHVEEGRVEQLLELDVLAKVEPRSPRMMMMAVLMVHFVVAAKMGAEMTVRAGAKLPEQVVKVLEKVVKAAGFEAAVPAERGVAHLVILPAFVRVPKHLQKKIEILVR